MMKISTVVQRSEAQHGLMANDDAAEDTVQSHFKTAGHN